MAIDTVLSFDRTTAANNVDVDGVGIQGSSPISSGNDAIQSFMKLIGAALTRRVAKSGSATAAKTDHAQFWDFTAAATLGLTAAATLTDGWCLYVKATGGAVTIDPNSAELVDGVATVVLSVGQSALVVCNGTGFYTILNSQAAPFPAGHLSGLTLANDVSDATNDITIAAGSARDSTDTVNIVLASGLIKRLDAAWAVGTNQGGLSTGSIADTTYFVFVIRRPDTGVTDVLLDVSPTSPTLPANYTQFRRIGAILRVSGVIVPFTQEGDYFRRVTQGTIENSLPTVGWAALAVGVPVGIKVRPLLSGAMATGSPITAHALDIADGDQPSTPTSSVRVLQITFANETNAWAYSDLLTNTSGQIRRNRIATSGNGASYFLYSHGWVDTRGRLQ